jgi:hypothetical protein
VRVIIGEQDPILEVLADHREREREKRERDCSFDRGPVRMRGSDLVRCGVTGEVGVL